MSFSHRPQRYTKCVIKEGDMFLNKPQTNELEVSPVNPLEKEKLINYLKVPVRLIMNNRTLSVFEGEEYKTITHTFMLKRSSFIEDGEHKGCFYIKESLGEPVRFCDIQEDQKHVEQWDYDFNLFKFQCNNGRQEYVTDVQNKMNEKIAEIKKHVLIEIHEKNKEKAEENEEKKMDKDVKNCNTVALKAIEKELNVEEMIRREEILREKKEEAEMEKRIKQEESRSECLSKAIKEKELENQFNQKEEESLETMKNIKTAALKEVQHRRVNLKKIIAEMRDKQKRKQVGLANRLQAVKFRMAKKMSAAYKKGNMQNCVKAKKGQNEQVRKNYCIANFSDDILQFQECNASDDFCHLCCDNEFGNFNQNERKMCYKAACADPETEDLNASDMLLSSMIH